ncbi:L,D-transpeptidase [Nitratireductor pacificus]|uniref:L,D-transpeptidase n=1 Tax=Nitratireductor pacificus TaxID=1231180 RepID=UPI0002EF54DB|nr:L,D-transpeptidase [Nitratireductor pacificus]
MKHFLCSLAVAGLLLVGAVPEGFASSLVARVSVSKQTMTVTHRGRVLHRWRVSTARRGYVTPRGQWRPKRMHRMWHSRKYDMSPMPYSIFYHGGYAIHGTNAVSKLGRPASHGCVRLDTANAARLYALVKKIGPRNTRIVVTD